jgi:hypothetical protein
MICPYSESFVCPYGVEDDPDVCCSCLREEAYK